MSNNLKNLDNTKSRARQKYKTIIAMQMQLDDDEVRYSVMKNNPSQLQDNKKTGGLKWRYAKSASITI